MQQQKMLMYVFPIMFAVFGINFPVGVLVYWLTTNVWTMGQQMFVIRRNPTPGSKAFEERQERLRAAGKIVEDPAEVAAKQAAEEARHNRQQPKRQTKSKRQTGGAPAGGAQNRTRAGSASDDSGSGQGAAKKPSLEKKDAQEGKGKGGASGSRTTKSGQRKGQQRPKHPTKK
jgi:YidC/Oxa1 family membrane protein insertase